MTSNGRKNVVMGNQEEDAKSELRSRLDEAEEKGKEISRRGRRLIETGQWIGDLARATGGLLPFPLPSTGVEDLIENWDAIIEQEDAALTSLHDASLEAIISTTTTASLTATTMIGPAILIEQVPKESVPAAKAARRRYLDTTRRSIKPEELVSLMEQLGLEKAPNERKSPVELLHTAYDAFNRPVREGDPASTSLLPMRECIQACIDQLLLRRPKQERARPQREKILSIGRQLKRDTMQMSTVETWADKWEQLLDDLSQAKRKDIPRDEWDRLLQLATQFLSAFLAGLDPAKLKT